MLAIAKGFVSTSHKAIAVCEWTTYDVWGNARDGFQVNDVNRQGEIEIPVTMTIANVPMFPGAKDEHREFPASGSFNTEILVSFTLEDADIINAFDYDFKINIDSSDGMHYTINKESNGKPMAEITILHWKAVE